MGGSPFDLFLSLPVYEPGQDQPLIIFTLVFSQMCSLLSSAFVRPFFWLPSSLASMAPTSSTDGLSTRSFIFILSVSACFGQAEFLFSCSLALQAIRKSWSNSSSSFSLSPTVPCSSVCHRHLDAREVVSDNVRTSISRQPKSLNCNHLRVGFSPFFYQNRMLHISAVRGCRSSSTTQS